MLLGSLGRGPELKEDLKDGKHFIVSCEADRVSKNEVVGKCEFMLGRNET